MMTLDELQTTTGTVEFKTGTEFILRGDILDDTVQVNHLIRGGRLDFETLIENYRERKFAPMTFKIETVEHLREDYDAFIISCTFKVENDEHIKFVEGISFEGWMKNSVTFGKRKMKLSKALSNLGWSDLVKRYNETVRESFTGYVTVSGMLQHIVGMSSLSDKGWENGTSCMDSTCDVSDELNHMYGSVSDENLYVAFLHDKAHDVDNLGHYVKARCLVRLFEFEGRNIMIPSRSYGNSKTKVQLNDSLKEIQKVTDIFSYDVRNGDYELTSDVTGARVECERFVSAQIELSKTVDIECICCNGTGELELEHERDTLYVTCPRCEGEGWNDETIEDVQEVSEWIFDTHTFYTYADDYKVDGNIGKVHMMVDYEMITRSAF